MTLNREYYTPLIVGVACTAIRLAVQVTTLAATAVVRLGLHSSDANYLPSTLLVDGGTIDASTTGAKEVTISQALTPGVYWLVAVAQTAAATVRGVNLQNIWPLYNSSNNADANTSGYFEAGITGALASRAASDATLLGNFQTTVPRIAVKVTVP